VIIAFAVELIGLGVNPKLLLAPLLATQKRAHDHSLSSAVVYKRLNVAVRALQEMLGTVLAASKLALVCMLSIPKPTIGTCSIPHFKKIKD
jgi:hypothetical protein